MGWENDPIVQSSWQNDPIIDEQKPADQVGPVGAALISGGRWLDKKAAGLREAVGSLPMIGASVVNALDTVDKWSGVKTPDASQYRNPQPAMEALAQRHPVANFIGDFVPSAMTVNPVAMGVMAGLDPGSAGERAINAGMAYGGGKVGQYVGGKIADVLGSRVATNAAELSSKQVANATKDATLAEARAAGYVFPPDQINPSLINRALGGLSGKISTAQGAAIKNEPVTLSLAKSALGLPEDAPLTKETLQQVRSIAGEAYKSAKGLGPIQVDQQFGKTVQDLTAEYRALVSDFPSQKNGAIDTLIKDLDKSEFNSASLIELVKRLRSDGRANLKAFDDPAKKALGQVQMGAQSAIEDLLDRNLQASGNGDFLQVFRNARAMIAKSYTIENALEESTGKVVASKIAKEFKQGVPLSGSLATIGKTAQAYPKALQNINTAMPGLSPLDYLAGLGSGHAGVAFARPLTRATILSGPYQNLMVKPTGYGPGASDALMSVFANNPDLTKKLGGLLGLGALQTYRQGN